MMKSKNDLKPLIALLKEMQNLSSAISLMSWDQETYMPRGSAQARAEQISGLMALVHEQRTGQEMSRVLSKWVDLETGDLKSDWDNRCPALLREVWRDYHHAIRLPSEFVKTLGLETSLAHQVWIEARKNKNFSFFAPSLKKIVALKKEEAEYLGYKDSPYDPLLDKFEPGMTVSQIVPIFLSLKEKLVPLLKRIGDAPHQPDSDFLRQYYDEEAQIAFGKRVLEAMGFSFQMGRQDLSAHPFTTSFHPSDVRVTTRVDPHDLLSSLFSSIHEGGHALYDQGLSTEDFGTPLGESISLGIHESQSRLWENGVGRSRPFWKHFFPILQKTFPDALERIDLERFYSAINAVRPSMIRVEADEVTYNLHIMLRFEIERTLIENDIDIDTLPDLWNEKTEEFLGIRPSNDAEGLLQDIHWSGGAFGYFPTYTLGNLYAAQFFKQAKIEIPDLEPEIEKGNLLPLKKWLNQKIHRWGRQYTSDELVRKVTDEPLNPNYFTNYLHEKFGELYRLS
ncbi:carboxypeptidase M32 [Nitrospira defluvii]|nr:carboxypeptidase M32 [Nitrospira defluvii]